MAKKTSKVHYLYNGEMQPLTKIFRENRKYLDDRTLEQMFYLLVDDLNSAKYWNFKVQNDYLCAKFELYDFNYNIF